MVARAPRKRMYRTMQGRMIDIEKLRAANESTQAVGNMNVNAKGDVLGAGGKVVTPKETVIRKYYEQPKGMVSDTPVSKPMPAPRREPPKPIAKANPIVPKTTKKTVAKPKTETKSTFSPDGLIPAFIGPPETKIAGTFILTIAINIPGTILSQLAMQTTPSNLCASTTDSTLSVINSLLGSEYLIPIWPIAIPSSTPIVLNSKGTPPASLIDCFAIAPSSSR